MSYIPILLTMILCHTSLSYSLWYCVIHPYLTYCANLIFHTQHATSARKFFVEILICFICYQIEDHPDRHAQSQSIIKYAHYVPLQNIHTVNVLPAIGSALTAKKTTIIALLPWAALQEKVSMKKRQEIIQSTNSHQYSSIYQASHSHSHPAHSYSQVLAHSNSSGNSSSMTAVKTNGGQDNITIPIQSIPTFDKSSVSNAVISTLIATDKNCAEPGTIETVLNSPLTANGPHFQNG